MKMTFAGMLAMAAVSATGVLHAQTSGVSHPEQVTITASPQTAAETGIAQAGTYEAAPAVVLTPKPSAAIPMSADEPVYRPTPPAVVLRTRPVETALPSTTTTGSAVTSAYTAAPATGASVRTADVDGLIAGDVVPGGVAEAQGDPDAGIVTRVAGPGNELPAGTVIKVRMAEGFSTQSTAAGTAFSGTLTEPVMRDGRVLLPAGSVMNGRVTDVHSGRRVSGTASIYLRPMNVTLPDGTRYPLHAQVIDTSETGRTKVDSEGQIEGRDHAKATLAVVGLAAGGGVAAGALVAGVPGAVVGGLVGAGVATVLWLKHDRQMAVPAGTVVAFQLNSALVVGGM